MITAIPTRDGRIAARCEEAHAYTFVESEGSEPLKVQSVEISESAGPDQHAGIIGQHGAARLLAQDIGPATIAALEKKGILVFYGAVGSIGDALEIISQGILDEAMQGCGSSCSSGSCGSCGCGK